MYCLVKSQSYSKQTFSTKCLSGPLSRQQLVERGANISAAAATAAHSDEGHRSYSKEAHGEPPFPLCRQFFHKKTIHSTSTPKSPSEGEQNSGKALKRNKICAHQIQLYHCSICEKVLAGSKNVHKQFINSGACEKWCGWCFYGNQVMRSDKASWDSSGELK